MKKIISIFTAICIVLTLTGVSAVTISTNDTSKENTNMIAEREINETVKYDTAIYGNAPTYLMEDSFSGGKNAVYGWDTDLRGGGLSGLEWGEFQMVDTSDSECVSMQKHFIPHKSGKVTFESCVRPYEITDGFYYELTGNDKRLFKFMTYRGYLCLDFSNGSYQRLAKYNAGERITVRADIDLDNQNAVMVIVAVCAAILLIGALKRQKEWLINLLFRTVTGTLGIFFINLGLANWGMQSTIGINTVTVLTTAILGFPGLFLLYGIHFYNTM